MTFPLNRFQVLCNHLRCCRCPTDIHNSSAFAYYLPRVCVCQTSGELTTTTRATKLLTSSWPNVLFLTFFSVVDTVDGIVEIRIGRQTKRVYRESWFISWAAPASQSFVLATKLLTNARTGRSLLVSATYMYVLLIVKNISMSRIELFLAATEGHAM